MRPSTDRRDLNLLTRRSVLCVVALVLAAGGLALSLAARDDAGMISDAPLEATRRGPVETGVLDDALCVRAELGAPTGVQTRVRVGCGDAAAVVSPPHSVAPRPSPPTPSPARPPSQDAPSPAPSPSPSPSPAPPTATPPHAGDQGVPPTRPTEPPAGSAGPPPHGGDAGVPRGPTPAPGPAVEAPRDDSPTPSPTTAPPLPSPPAGAADKAPPAPSDEAIPEGSPADDASMLPFLEAVWDAVVETFTELVLGLVTVEPGTSPADIAESVATTLLSTQAAAPPAHGGGSPGVGAPSPPPGAPASPPSATGAPGQDEPARAGAAMPNVARPSPSRAEATQGAPVHAGTFPPACSVCAQVEPEPPGGRTVRVGGVEGAPGATASPSLPGLLARMLGSVRSYFDA